MYREHFRLRWQAVVLAGFSGWILDAPLLAGRDIEQTHHGSAVIVASSRVRCDTVKPCGDFIGFDIGESALAKVGGKLAPVLAEIFHGARPAFAGQFADNL